MRLEDNNVRTACYQKDYLVQKISDLCELIDQMYITGESIESFLDELEQALLTLAECRSEDPARNYYRTAAAGIIWQEFIVSFSIL